MVEQGFVWLQSPYSFHYVKKTFFLYYCLKILLLLESKFMSKPNITRISPDTCPGVGLQDHQTIIWKDTCTLMFIAALFKVAKTWKQPKCLSTDEWIKKM